METTLVPVAGKHPGPLFRQLHELCTNAKLFEEIVARWTRPGQSIVVGLNKETPEPMLSISFLLNSETIALAQLPLNRVRAIYPFLTPLKEEIIETPGKAEFKPDDQWFDQRNNRLGVFVDEAFDMNFAPPESLVELVMSYALSSAGFAEIQAYDGENLDCSILLKASLVFLGLEDQQGWYESVLIDKKALKNYLRLRAMALN